MGDVVGFFGKLFPQKYIPVILASVLEAGSSPLKHTNRDREDLLTERLCERIIKFPAFRDGPLDIRNKVGIILPTRGEVDLLVSCGHGYEVNFSLKPKDYAYFLPKEE